MTTPNAQQTILLLHFDDWCIDSSTYAHTVVSTNTDVRQASATPKFGRTLYYEGAANSAGVPLSIDSPVLDLSRYDAWSIDFWWRQYTSSTNRVYTLCGVPQSWCIAMPTGTAKTGFYTWEDGAWVLQAEVGTRVTTTYRHHAVTYNKGVLRVYYNGDLESTTTNIVIPAAFSVFQIGNVLDPTGSSSRTSSPLCIDELRVVAGVDPYDKSSTYTVPTAAYPAPEHTYIPDLYIQRVI